MKIKRKFFVLSLLCLLLPGIRADEITRLAPEEDLNQVLLTLWRQNGVTPAPPASDAVFCRRVHLDLTGKLPAPEEVRRFLRDNAPDKREKLIDRLLDSPEYADLMGMYRADLFRIKSEFPINLWPNAVQLFHRYLRDGAVQDRSWRDMTREMLTGCGSNFRFPEANFFRTAADRSPEGLAKITALTFMGLRTERLTAEQRRDFARFFSRICYKGTDEWKEEIVIVNPIPATVTARTPDGKKFVIRSPETDPREVFADWLLAPQNPWFARAAVNRVWAMLFGRGIIDPADDLPLPPKQSFLASLFRDPPPPERCISPQLLDFLAREFASNGYRFKPLLRTILRSRAYQSSAFPAQKSQAEKARKFFAVYPVRRLEAEIIIDMLGSIARQYDRYTSVIPEPFTFLPRGFSAVQIPDGSISSAVLDNFGRPPRDSGLLAERKNAITASQRQYLMNSGVIYGRLAAMPNQLFRRRKLSMKQKIEEIYLLLLSRFPTPQEQEHVLHYIKSRPRQEQAQAIPDLLWVLINTREFLYRH